MTEDFRPQVLAGPDDLVGGGPDERAADLLLLHAGNDRILPHASGLTRFSGRSPARMRSISWAAATPARERDSMVTAERCGVRITLSSAKRGCPGARR